MKYTAILMRYESVDSDERIATAEFRVDQTDFVAEYHYGIPYFGDEQPKPAEGEQVEIELDLLAFPDDIRPTTKPSGIYPRSDGEFCYVGLIQQADQGLWLHCGNVALNVTLSTDEAREWIGKRVEMRGLLQAHPAD